MKMNTAKEIKVHDTVWVDMTNWVDMSSCEDAQPRESGYAIVIGMWEAPGTDAESNAVMYAVRFRGSDKVIEVNEHRVTPINDDDEDDVKEDTMHAKHYRNAVVEPILVMQDCFSREELIGFLKGNILKYRLRMGHKGTEEDVKADYDKICVYEMWLDIIKNGERIEL